MEKCSSCKFFIRAFFLDRENSDNFRLNNECIEASYFKIEKNSAEQVPGTCINHWKLCFSDNFCDSFSACEDHTFPLETAMFSERLFYKTSISTPKSNEDLYAYYATNLCPSSISKLEAEKVCGFCQYWQENPNNDDDIPPAYIPYYINEDRCIVNSPIKGKCFLNGHNTSFSDTCTICENLQGDFLPEGCDDCQDESCIHRNKLKNEHLRLLKRPKPIMSYEERLNMSRRRMRALMRLEAMYIINNISKKATNLPGNKYYMNLVNSFNISTNLEDSEKFVILFPSLFRGMVKSSYDTVKKMVTSDDPKKHFNMDVVNDFARYYHVPKSYLLCYDTYKGDLSDVVSVFLFGNEKVSLFKILSVVEKIIYATLNADKTADFLKTFFVKINSYSFLVEFKKDTKIIKWIKKILHKCIDKKGINADDAQILLFSYSISILWKAGYKNIIKSCFLSPLSKTNALLDLLNEKLTRNTRIRNHEVNRILPSEEFLVKIASLISAVPADTLAGKSADVMHLLFSSEKGKETKAILLCERN